MQYIILKMHAKKSLGSCIRSNFKCTKLISQTERNLNAFIVEMKKIPLHLIVNNAGAFPDGEDYNNYDMSIWDDIFAVNVTAPFAISTGLKSTLVENGVIINIASTDGFKGSFSSMSYAASKAALINVTQSLAINFGYDEKHIRVVALAPGWVKVDVNIDPRNFLEGRSSDDTAREIC